MLLLLYKCELSLLIFQSSSGGKYDLSKRGWSSVPAICNAEYVLTHILDVHNCFNAPHPRSVRKIEPTMGKHPPRLSRAGDGPNTVRADEVWTNAACAIEACSRYRSREEVRVGEEDAYNKDRIALLF